MNLEEEARKIREYQSFGRVVREIRPATKMKGMVDETTEPWDWMIVGFAIGFIIGILLAVTTRLR